MLQRLYALAGGPKEAIRRYPIVSFSELITVSLYMAIFSAVVTLNSEMTSTDRSLTVASKSLINAEDINCILAIQQSSIESLERSNEILKHGTTCAANYLKVTVDSLLADVKRLRHIKNDLFVAKFQLNHIKESPKVNRDISAE
ncbi:hypothetical protein GJ496_009644 [Pomphorhynchus laevis]|nr:hypothetical protein GJ496_009644 [Pomphorhynchus laevis]